MMWLLLARAPAPDAADWPGRRLLGIADAIVWPAAFVTALWFAPLPTGIILPVAGAFAAFNAITRAHTALVANHRYRFTSWRFARFAILLTIVGLALKVGVGWR